MSDILDHKIFKHLIIIAKIIVYLFAMCPISIGIATEGMGGNWLLRPRYFNRTANYAN